jgi:hypothetical protein
MTRWRPGTTAVMIDGRSAHRPTLLNTAMPAFRSPVRHAAALSLAISLPACGSGERTDRAAPEDLPPDPATACIGTSPVPVAIAVQDFIRSAEPTPERFLNAATTDSALPAAAEVVVSRKGPMFYWLPDETAQQQMQAKLERDGPWVNMLVVVRGQLDGGDGTWTIRVGGKYIGGPQHGTESPEKRYTVSCILGDTNAWKVTDVAVAGGA